MSEATGPYGALVRLQETDLRLDQLHHQITHHPIHAKITELHDRAKSLERLHAPTLAQVGLLRERQRAIEGEVVELTTRLGEIDARLTNADSGSFRDQTAMSQEMATLADRRDALEEEELGLMEESEPLEATLANAARESEALRTRALELHRQMLAEQRELETESEEISARRIELAGEVVPLLLVEYERIRSHLGGVGVARLVHGMCSGCNLALSATELDRVTHARPEMLAHCDQCGRILIP